MKRLILFLFLQVVLVSFTTSVFAQTPKVILQHDGAVTLYEANQLQNAINDAAEGDVIYLGEGTYNGSVSIDKRISIIGAGQSSIISGSVNITFSETEFSGAHGYLMESLNISTNLIVKSAINDFRIRKVFVGNTLNLNETNTKVVSANVDMCRIGSLYYSSSVAELFVNNTKIATLRYSNASCCTLTNCNIRDLSYDTGSYYSFYGKIVNCIVEKCYSTPLGGNGQAINSLLSKSWAGGSYVQGCYSDSNITLDTNMDCNYTKENLILKGYLGIDGTVVGIDGGTNPFSLDPNTPSVYDSNISVDNATNKLKVTLKVKVE